MGTDASDALKKHYGPQRIFDVSKMACECWQADAKYKNRATDASLADASFALLLVKQTLLLLLHG